MCRHQPNSTRTDTLFPYPPLGLSLFGLPATPTLRASLLVALACRIALMLTDGGQAQLWLASIGVAAAVAWTVLGTEQYGDELGEGFLAAIALAAAPHPEPGTRGAGRAVERRAGNEWVVAWESWVADE